MLPIDKIKKGYLTWNENFNLSVSSDCGWFKQITIRIKYLYRRLFNKPHTYFSLYEKYYDAKRDIECFDSDRFFRDNSIGATPYSSHKNYSDKTKKSVIEIKK